MLNKRLARDTSNPRQIAYRRPRVHNHAAVEPPPAQSLLTVARPYNAVPDANLYQPAETLTLGPPPPHPASPPPGAERGVTAALRISSPPLGAERPGEVGATEESDFRTVGIKRRFARPSS